MLIEKEKMYSRESFEEYKYRAKVKFILNKEEFTIDVYTTDEDKDNVSKVLSEKTNKKAVFEGIIHWATREQDELASEMIDEWILKDSKKEVNPSEEDFEY